MLLLCLPYPLSGDFRPPPTDSSVPYITDQRMPAIVGMDAVHLHYIVGVPPVPVRPGRSEAGAVGVVQAGGRTVYQPIQPTQRYPMQQGTQQRGTSQERPQLTSQEPSKI